MNTKTTCNVKTLGAGNLITYHWSEDVKETKFG
jgi:hypothetical protein